MGRSLGFGSLPPNWTPSGTRGCPVPGPKAFRLAFAVPPRNRFSLLGGRSDGPIMQKVPGHWRVGEAARAAAPSQLPGGEGTRLHGLFTPSGVSFTVPSQYSFTIGPREGCAALKVVLQSSCRLAESAVLSRTPDRGRRTNRRAGTGLTPSAVEVSGPPDGDPLLARTTDRRTTPGDSGGREAWGDARCGGSPHRRPLPRSLTTTGGLSVDVVPCPRY